MVLYLSKSKYERLVSELFYIMYLPRIIDDMIIRIKIYYVIFICSYKLDKKFDKAGCIQGILL